MRNTAVSCFPYQREWWTLSARQLLATLKNLGGANGSMILRQWDRVPTDTRSWSLSDPRSPLSAVTGRDPRQLFEQTPTYQRLGEAAKMPFRIHPHMLRHACGYKLLRDFGRHAL